MKVFGTHTFYEVGGGGGGGGEGRLSRPPLRISKMVDSKVCLLLEWALSFQ